MDSYSINQLHGEIGNTDHCGSYYTYGALGLTQTVGGYRVNRSADLHPCGEVMSTFNQGRIYKTQIPYTWLTVQEGPPTLILVTWCLLLTRTTIL